MERARNKAETTASVKELRKRVIINMRVKDYDAIQKSKEL